MILLKKSMLEGLDSASPSLASVQTALQRAIELEHATIPTYLYGLYSLIPTKNDAIADIIHSVVVEEMLHMTLACNVLNAIGGSPLIDSPTFIPTFPGPLPGGVESSLTVHLRPFSMEQLATFLKIEEPEHPLEFKAMALAEEALTIGMFYQAIIEALERLEAEPGTSIFAPSAHNQIGPDLMSESVVVTDLKTAKQALRVIVEQGEGTANSPEEVVGGGYAHYYRFQQIQKGRALIKNPQGTTPNTDYTFSGAAIPFDTSGVYPIPADPKKTSYPAGSQQAFENDTFNYTYTSLLNSLHKMFNGDNTQKQFNRAIGLMMSLKGQARAMVSGLPNPSPTAGEFVGPSFEYQPVSPGPKAT